MPLAPSTSHPSSTNRRHYLTPWLNAYCFGVVVMFDTTALWVFSLFDSVDNVFVIVFVCPVPIF